MDSEKEHKQRNRRLRVLKRTIDTYFPVVLFVTVDMITVVYGCPIFPFSETNEECPHVPASEVNVYYMVPLRPISPRRCWQLVSIDFIPPIRLLHS
jgi:hypothetical protein